MARLAIFGTGGFGRELIAPALAQAEREGRSLVFVEDNPRQDSVLGVPVIEMESLDRGDDVVAIAIGDGSTRARVAARVHSFGLGFARLAAPTALVGPDVELGEGAVLCDFTILTASARIGAQFQCNIYSYVAHDCRIGDNVTFAPKVCCNGNVHIADGVYVGTGAIIRQGTPTDPIVIGQGAIIGMGAVVTKSVAAGVVVVGNPAREKA